MADMMGTQHDPSLLQILDPDVSGQRLLPEGKTVKSFHAPSEIGDSGRLGTIWDGDFHFELKRALVLNV